MKTNYREPATKTLREQPFEPVYASIVGCNLGPREVIHDLGQRVWVWSEYSEQWPAAIVQVGDGLNNGYDRNGMRIISVPEYMCHFMSEGQAEDLHACMDADQAMLANAY